MRSKCIIIAGATATGKTSLSVELAQLLNGAIVNADSMQVYRGMDIGTAKPTPKEQKGIPHFLLDVVDPDAEFNAAIYQKMALPIISEIVSQGKTCLVTGGTGLYIKGLTKRFFQCPSSDPEFKQALRLECDAKGSNCVHERLQLLDPESALRIHPNDSVRIIRALEIIHLTGRRFSELLKKQGYLDTSIDTLKICLDVDRKTLYKRIDARTLMMVAQGFAEETENLLIKGYSPDLKSMQAIGYRHMVQYLRKKWSLEETIHSIQRDTRRYAKRQITWFRGDPEYEWIAPEDKEQILARIRAFLDPALKS